MNTKKVQTPKAVEKNMLSFLPTLEQERAKKFTTLALTLFLLCVFGFFAIAPTLSTIAELNKKIDDSTYVSEQLDTKIQNLSTLHTLYSQIEPNLPVVFAAIPQVPTTTYLVGQLQQLAQSNNVSVQSIQVEQVDLTKKAAETSSFIFIMTLSGNKDQLDAFTRSLSSFDRIITIDSITYSQNGDSSDAYTLNIRAKAYFKQ